MARVNECGGFFFGGGRGRLGTRRAEVWAFLRGRRGGDLVVRWPGRLRFGVLSSEEGERRG